METKTYDDKKVRCSCCGRVVCSQKFCSECGMKFDGSEEIVSDDVPTYHETESCIKRENNLSQTSEEIRDVIPKHIEPARGMLDPSYYYNVINSGDAPGKNGRGAIHFCPRCGHRFADTGIGCPFCGLEKTKDEKRQFQKINIFSRKMAGASSQVIFLPKANPRHLFLEFRHNSLS